MHELKGGAVVAGGMKDQGQALKAEAEVQRQETTSRARSYKSPYQLWKESQGLDTIYGFSVPDVYTAKLTPWEARGGSGVFVNLDGSAGFNDSYIYELAPRESSTPIKHDYAH